MARNNYDFTSESVSEGHPDKVCDGLSDAILDEIIRVDPKARVGCEAFATTNRVVIGGEVGFSPELNLKMADIDYESIVRHCIREIGYEQEGFHWKTLIFENYLHEQSADIALGVDKDGAGDQGIMFGYAVNETAELMPAPIHYAHAILKELSEARRKELSGVLGPDSKSQITVEYKNEEPVAVKSIVLSTQHFDPNLSSENVKEIIEPYVAGVLPNDWITSETIWHVNPTGKFVIGGPDGDAGLTGRKIIVDTYGGSAPHGGGAFSGKDPTKVDRSAAYVARYLAKNVVASGLAARCCIQLSYAIGVSEPLSIYVNTYGSGKVSDLLIEKSLKSVVDLTPIGIIDTLKLRRPIYSKTSSYGHFGRKSEEDGGFSWERTDLVKDILKKF